MNTEPQGKVQNSELSQKVRKWRRIFKDIDGKTQVKSSSEAQDSRSNIFNITFENVTCGGAELRRIIFLRI